MIFNKNLWWGYAIIIAVACIIGIVFNEFLVWEKISLLWGGMIKKLLSFELSFYRILLPSFIMLFLVFLAGRLVIRESEYIRSVIIVVLFLLFLLFFYLFGWLNIFSYNLLGQIRALIVLLFVYDVVSMLPFYSDSYNDEDYNVEERLSAMTNLSFVVVWFLLILGLCSDSSYRFWIGLGICVLNIFVFCALFVALGLCGEISERLDKKKQKKAEK